MEDKCLNLKELNKFQNFSPHFIHIVNRVSSSSWNIPLSYMKSHNLAFIYDGEASFIFDSVEYKVSKGSLIYSTPGVGRIVENSKESPVKLIAVDFLYACPLYQSENWEMTSPKLPFKTCDNIGDKYLLNKLHTQFDDLSRIWLSDYSDKLIRCRALFTDIINTLLLNSCGSSPAYDRIQKVEKVIDHMTYHYDKKISLKDYAQIINISVPYLCVIFKEVTGKSPVEYVINIRINKAKELLSDGCSVTEVSSAIGFNDIYYFSKCFKRHTGINPSLYKDKI
jgi:AraC-like DNA-binding protein